jgi:glycosyltransferase involved in cell wall biosynthesis
VPNNSAVRLADGTSPATLTSAGPPAAAPGVRRHAAPIRVAVLIDLEWSADAGGHVKCWQRLAEAAARSDQAVDITICALGDRDETTALSPSVRLRTIAPLLSTRRVSLLGHVPDHTDLAPLYPRLVPWLGGFDILHTTDPCFALAASARVASRLYGRPLTTSNHTETPAYTRIFADQILHRTFGEGWLGSLLRHRLALPQWLMASMQRRAGKHYLRCRAILLSARDDISAYAHYAGAKVSVLRRGIDRDRFHPDRRDRAWLQDGFGIAPDEIALLFAGRIDAGKDAMTLARAARMLIDEGLPIRVVMAGRGSERHRVAALLGDRVSLPGHVTQDELALLYASADIFVLPSRVEHSPNVVIEAKASGLPVIVAPGGGGTFVRQSGIDGILVADRDPAAWAAAIRGLATNRARRAAIAAAGLVDARSRFPTWDDVFGEDLLPVWRRVAARAG